MAYPEKGVSYRHQPKFLERAMRAENERAAGGPINADGGGRDTADALPADEGSGYQTHYSGETNSAGPGRMTEESGNPPFRGRAQDTEMDTDTDFGQAHEVKTLADRLAPIKPQYLGGGNREDRRPMRNTKLSQSDFNEGD